MAAINRARLRRWHVWLGWLIAIPMILWTVSGVVMVWKPIDEVRGEGLMAPPSTLKLTGPVIIPRLAAIPLKSLALQPMAAGPRWVVTLADGTTRLADPASGALLPRLSAADAVHWVAGSRLRCFAATPRQASPATCGRIHSGHGDFWLMCRSHSAALANTRVLICPLRSSLPGVAPVQVPSSKVIVPLTIVQR